MEEPGPNRKWARCSRHRFAGGANVQSKGQGKKNRPNPCQEERNGRTYAWAGRAGAGGKTPRKEKRGWAEAARSTSIRKTGRQPEEIGVKLPRGADSRWGGNQKGERTKKKE